MDINNNPINQEQEIDLKDIIKQSWRKRKFIFIVTCIAAFIGLFVTFSSPVVYSTSITLVPQTGQRNTGSLGGFAAMMGVSTGEREALSPVVYPMIVNSVPFIRQIMATPIVVKRSKGVPITLYEFYTNEKFQPKSIMKSIKRYTVGLPGLILSTLSGSDGANEGMVVLDKEMDGIYILTQNERKVLEIIRKNIHINFNDREGHVTLGFSFSDPKASAVITQQLYNLLESYVTDFKAQKQVDNLQFVESNFKEAQQNFFIKNAELAAFIDANRLLSTATARTTEMRMHSENEIAFNVYNELAIQLEQARLAVNESTPVFTVISPVVVPHEKSAPRKPIILAAFLFLGVIGSIGWVLVKPFVREIVEEVKREE